MEPLPETVEALAELDPDTDDEPLQDHLRQSAALVQIIAPDVAGFSIATRRLGVTFTVVATDEEMAARDGVQYLTHGPCVEALDEQQRVATTSDHLFSEPRWRAFAEATSAAGIRSTLTLPVLEDDEVTGTVNLYGRSETTFEGKHELLAVVFDAWAPGAMTNADLAFTTRRLAQEAPEHLRNEAVITTAAGMLAALLDAPVDTARDVLEDSAARAGVPAAALAQTVIDLYTTE